MNDKLILTSLRDEQAQEIDAESSAASARLSEDYLADESRLRGRAERLFRPSSESELISVLRAAADSGTPLTLSGARTGITGGAVPDGGWLVSFDRMQSFTGMTMEADGSRFRLKCQPGVSLDLINKSLAKKEFPGQADWPEPDRKALAAFRAAGPFIFPPDPTETTASLGGMTACNASGARTLYYGPVRNYIARLRAITSEGYILDLERGKYFGAAGGEFELALPDAGSRKGRIPSYRMPRVKNAAGFFVEPRLDMLDLLIGSEGTLAAFSEIEILLVKAPAAILSVLGFFGAESEAIEFVRAARGEFAESGSSPLPRPLMALEFFDAGSLQILREQKLKQGAGSVIPTLPEADAAVYIELALNQDSDAELEAAAEAILGLLEQHGSDPDAAWSAFSEAECRRLKDFRHALPEAVNQRVAERAAACPGLTKLGTDFSVPRERLSDLLAAYRDKLQAAALDYCVFGHIGNDHLHANILARDAAEYEKGKEIYEQLALLVADWGGSVSAEHGIGKLKKQYLRLMLGGSAVDEMKATKSVFDPASLLNRGNLFD